MWNTHRSTSCTRLTGQDFFRQVRRKSDGIATATASWSILAATVISPTGATTPSWLRISRQKFEDKYLKSAPRSSQGVGATGISASSTLPESFRIRRGLAMCNYPLTLRAQQLFVRLGAAKATPPVGGLLDSENCSRPHPRKHAKIPFWPKGWPPDLWVT